MAGHTKKCLLEARLKEADKMVTVIICSFCGRHATKQMKWEKSESGREEVLVCECGRHEWKFRLEDPSTVKAEYLVVAH
jgi:hypothetical protein